MPVLSVHDLSLSFNTVRAVNGVDFEVEAGEVFGIVGPDSAGKSTLARLLAGLLTPDQGTVTIQDMDIRKYPDRAREHLGYMPQQYSLYGDLSVSENLQFFADMFFVAQAEREKRLQRLYEFSRLGPFSDRRAGQLSGGMYKKLALMCNMIHSPDLLILDEPTTGVDPLSRRELWEIIYTMVEEENIAIVVNTPYMDEAERCHRVGMMWEGTFLAVDTPEAILAGHPEHLYEFTVDDREAGSALSGRIEDVKRTYTIGRRMRAAFDTSLSEEEVFRRLKKAGAPEQSIQPVSPTFDDVFMVFRESGV